MNWLNLQQNKCPKSNDPISISGLLMPEYQCTNSTCDFKISETRFNEILRELYKPNRKWKSFDQNLAELNNLGRKEVSENFEDSI